MLLKKLLAGRPGGDSVSFIILLVVIRILSPPPLASPSKAAKASLAFTGSGAGTVLKPETLTVGCFFSVTTVEPSNKDIFRAGLEVSS